MNLVHQVLSLPDIDEVYDFAAGRLALAIPDEQERTFASWSAPWRREALEHHLKLGWSFITRENGKIEGFFLAQPFLFFRGQTQTLWVEHIEASQPEVADVLVEVAVKVAREKHLQRVLFANAPSLASELKRWNPEPLETSIAIVKTTKG
ncbi:MAG: hypothetical protein V4760_08420 [Bdellovibrionota bacterium]